MTANLKSYHFSLSAIWRILEEMAILIAKVVLSTCSLYTEDVHHVQAYRFAHKPEYSA